MVLSIMKVVVNGLGSIIGRDVELLVHDVRNPRHSTVAIANGHVTGRQVGDPIIAAPSNDKGFAPLLSHKLETRDVADCAEMLGTYTTRTKDGRELRSTTILLRNDTGEVFGTVCANSDLSMYQALHQYLGQVIQPAATAGDSRNERETRPSVDELIEEIIKDSIASIGKPVVVMEKDDKMRVIEIMMERGLFVIKGSAEKVASRLAVTRYTVYNYLAELKERPVIKPKRKN
jgi:predicted transcriptional regulator YheO